VAPYGAVTPPRLSLSFPLRSNAMHNVGPSAIATPLVSRGLEDLPGKKCR